MADTQRLLGDGTLGLLLGANEQDGATVGNRLLDIVEGRIDMRERLLQINDVTAGTLGQDKSLHLRVPPAGLVSEVNATVEQLADGNYGHGRTPCRHTPLSAAKSCLISCYRDRLARILVPGTHPPGVSTRSMTRTEWMW